MISLPQGISDALLKLAMETGSEFLAEIAADYILGRRAKEDPTRIDFLDKLKGADKAGLKAIIKANQLGIGLGDEQIMENDLSAIQKNRSVTVDEAAALDEFFYSGRHQKKPIAYCLTEREQDKYRHAHILETIPENRHLNLVTLAKLPSHEARRARVGSPGKLGLTYVEMAQDYLLKETPDTQQRIVDLKQKAAEGKSKFFGQPRPSFWQRPLWLSVRRRLGI